MCPADRPRCQGYVVNHKWGRCSPPSVGLADASEVSQNVLHRSGAQAAPGLAACAHGGGFYFDSGSTNWSIVDNVAEKLRDGPWFFENCGEAPEGSGYGPCSGIEVGTNFVDNLNTVSKKGPWFNSSDYPGTRLINPSAGAEWPSAARQIMASAGPRAGKAHTRASGAQGVGL